MSEPVASGKDAGKEASAKDGSIEAIDSGADVSDATLTCSEPALAFDGVDDFASVGDGSAFNFEDDFAVEAWIKPSERATTNIEMDVISHHDSNSNDPKGWVLRIKNGRAAIVVYVGGLGAGAVVSGNEDVAYVVPGRWAHVAATLEDKTLRLYYDGILRGTQELPDLSPRRLFSGALSFGRATATGSFPYEGELDDVRISNQARYTGATAPRPHAPLEIDATTVALWRFDEAGGTILRDSGPSHLDATFGNAPASPARVGATCIGDR